MLRNATVRQVNRQDHREEGPGRTGLQHKREEQRPPTGRQEATRDDRMPGSSDDHRQSTTETDVIDQSVVMDSGSARLRDEGADQGVLRMDQEEGISTEQARRRLISKQPARRSLTDDENSFEAKREATIAAIKELL